MKEFTPEQIKIIVIGYITAQNHMANAIGELRKMIDTIKTVNDRKDSFFSPFSDHNGELRLSQLSDDHLATYRKNLESGCWRMIIHNSGIMEMVTSDDRLEIERNIDGGVFGALTEENIADALRTLKSNEGDYVTRIAREAFRYFSPNYAQKEPIRQKVVKNCGSWGTISFSSSSSPAWEVLEKALLLLDRKPLPQKYDDHLAVQMANAVWDRRMEFECSYFRAKFYKKSLTAHLTFIRMDLIDQINKIGGIA